MIMQMYNFFVILGFGQLFFLKSFKMFNINSLLSDKMHEGISESVDVLPFCCTTEA